VFTNKHVVIALIIAPILSVLAWYAVGHLLGEQPAPAAPGSSYPLVEKSNCRYPSGQCELENAEFSITLRIVPGQQGPGQALTAVSAHPLEGIRVALLQPGDEEGDGRSMRQTDGEGRQWTVPLDEMPGDGTRILLAAVAGGSTWFGDVATRFAQAEDNVIPNPQ
jgi:hypothetical protein